jgi:hypothetical protein
MGFEEASERFLWLHHGSNSHALNGYVSLTLDNNDNRISVVGHIFVYVA